MLEGRYLTSVARTNDGLHQCGLCVPTAMTFVRAESVTALR